MSREPVFDRLPAPVAERVRRVSAAAPAAGARHVLYWMHHAVRGHENPALDAALIAAAALELPLLVYQGLGGDHRFNSDRHHTFILEGAREVRAELAGRGLEHLFWLGEDPASPSPLRALAAEAALVVTEDFPAPPFPRWTAALAGRTAAPVWAVDTACVVPMRLVERPFDRAYRFRDAIRQLLAGRLERPWAEVDELPPTSDRSRLPFEEVDLASADLAELVARCPIDHIVGPVAHTRGGGAAGYERWRRFRDTRLSSYAATRNDAAADGVSRLSPYLHHGQVSPLRIAREAATAGGKGAEKFLDELIVWRELAHNLCFHRHHEVESLAVLPEWARRTLADHAGDRREARSWESLARGRTGDRLWDLCQASLVRHGELHNNVRMTWGKAIPGWTADPERALEVLIDLNHRFALDGSDPNSYGGLLWCLGLFDRPFAPERPVLGAVRPRPTAAHARRLDLDRYARRVLAPATARALEVAVVGAGLSGLVAARTLADHGHRVRLFDKGRGVGGRASTRRANGWRFDHGAQYFTVRDRRFGRWVDSWRRDGLVAEWSGRIVAIRPPGSPPGEAAGVDGGDLDAGTRDEPRSDRPTRRFVGMPGMSAVCRHLAADFEVALETEVGELRREGKRWRLTTVDGANLGRYDAVVASAPAPQAAELLAAAAPALAARAAAVEMLPCWAAMVAFREPLELGFDGAFVRGSPLSWVARDASKPGRPAGESWVLHGSPEWSRRHLELAREEAAERLLAAFGEAVGGRPPEPVHLDAHRWRFALPPAPLPEPCLFEPDSALAACGDWCGGPRVEGAFLSGCAAAGRLLALRPDPAQPALFGDD